DRAEWDWVQQDSTGRLGISMGWHPEQGFIARNWDGYNEGMAVYLLAFGSQAHPVKDGAYQAWTAPYPKYWRGSGPTRHLAFAPAFGHQWGPMWIDYRGIRDATMREAGFDYFENCRRAAYAQRAYAIANPMGWAGYGANIWGLTACDGPGDVTLPYQWRTARFSGYSARGPLGEPDGFDDGTLAPTAALSFLPFAPEICLPATQALHRRYGAHIYGQYGFIDSFNPSFRAAGQPLERGTVIPGLGWVDSDYLGIDQGPILGMIANYRDGMIWQATRKAPNLVRGLRRAGFKGGWLGR
ncbi:MAG: Tat pathway signal protein, partial [Alphaproteobacteria bacterium]|nr:Tat pathway signal protein [Alphaproteobacteria bacterium]